MRNMYNENQKKAFIKKLNSNGVPQKLAENAFIGIASYEREMSTDICDVPVQEYPKILAGYCKEDNNIQRYSYYLDMLKMLVKYREFCAANGLITPAKYFESAGDQINYKDILEEFKKYSQSVKLQTPQLLYLFYSKLLNIQSENTPEDYYLGLLILYYFGLSNDDIASIKRSDVSNVNGETIINMDEYLISIPGECGVHIKKLAENTISATYYTERFKVYHMNKEFIFARSSDKTEEDRKKRMKNYMRYTVGKLKEEKNTPTLSDVKHQGTIYRLCADLIKDKVQKETFFNSTNKRIYAYYYYYYHNIRKPDENIKIGTSQLKAIEVKFDLEKEWEFLEEHR